jgi:Patatin-like phospholipase
VDTGGFVVAIRTPIGEFQDPGSPVRRIPGEPADEQPRDGTALCLSGGGYRAMLFHLGALWRLNELAILKDLDRVSSVSGGSITAAVLGMNWSRLGFDQAGVGQQFHEAVVDPIRKLANLSNASIHAAAKQGRREYSRSIPPSLGRHLIAPVLTARNWPFGGWSRSPRCGRALL